MTEIDYDQFMPDDLADTLKDVLKVLDAAEFCDCDCSPPPSDVPGLLGMLSAHVDAIAAGLLSNARQEVTSEQTATTEWYINMADGYTLVDDPNAVEADVPPYHVVLALMNRLEVAAAVMLRHYGDAPLPGLAARACRLATMLMSWHGRVALQQSSPNHTPGDVPDELHRLAVDTTLLATDLDTFASETAQLHEHVRGTEPGT